MPLTLKRNDVQNLLRILEFVEPMKIETMRGSEYYDSEFAKLVTGAKEADRKRP